MQISKLHNQFCDYQVTFRNNTPRTIVWFKSVIKSFQKHTGANHSYEITFHLVSKYFVDGKIKHNWSARTIKTRMSALNSFFKWCLINGYIEVNPIEKLPKPKIEKRIPKHLSITEASYIIEWLRTKRFRYKYEKSRAIAIFTTFIYTGIRLGELLNLRYSDVRFDDKIIFIKSGKGNKDRNIPLLNRLEVILKEYLKDREGINNDSIYFFVSIKKKSTMSYLVVKRLFKLISDNTGIHVYPHKMRHSFAVQMLEGGCDIYTLSRILGHSDIKTTTIYLTATTAQQKKQIEKHPLY